MLINLGSQTELGPTFGKRLWDFRLATMIGESGDPLMDEDAF